MLLFPAKILWQLERWQLGDREILGFPREPHEGSFEIPLHRCIYKVDLATVMIVLKLSSFLELERLTADIKRYLLNGYLNAFDLCIFFAR
jgi:hypothetical protein